MHDVIASSSNAHLKRIRKLARRKVREEEQALVVEGEDLVQAGLETGAQPRVLLVDSERRPTIDLDLAGVACPVLPVEPQLLASVSGLAHPPRIIGIFALPARVDLAVAMDARSVSGATGPWIALDALADPGNVGTVIRTAAALNAGGVVTLPGTADPFGPKAVRASMGAIFRVPLARLDSSDLDVATELDAVRARIAALRVVALDADADMELWDAELDATTLLVVGAERVGVSDLVRSSADQLVRIPQEAAVESMNAGVAASMALYEWRRSRGGVGS